MSIPQTPKPAKLVIGVFARDKKLVADLARELSSHYGQMDLVSCWMDFKYTNYYQPEMGSPLARRMFAFERLIEQAQLADVKIATNRMEQAYAIAGKRQVNVDPGYLLHERFVLASGKNFSHRIYLGLGVYADLTLIFQKGAFQKLPWTYPDYADQAVIGFLERVRRKYVFDFKSK